MKPIAVPCEILDGPDVTLKEIPKLYPILTKQVMENVELKTKIINLKITMRDLYGKLSKQEKKNKLKRNGIKRVKEKFSKVEITGSGKNLLSKVFSDAQINVLMGQSKVVWGDDDLAMAFSLRHLCSKECYLYLKEVLNIPLPALSCVQKWAASK